MEIRMTDSFRRNLVFVLNLVKAFITTLGAIGAIFTAMGLDSAEPYGSMMYKGCFISIGMILVGMFIEMFIVKFLIKENENMSTFYDFNWYGLKSRRNYLEYKRLMKIKRNRDKKFKKLMEMYNG